MALTKVYDTMLGDSHIPTQTSQSGKFLTTDRSDVSWGTVSSGTIPFYKADGSADNINLTSSGEIPFAKANGTTDNIALII